MTSISRNLPLLIDRYDISGAAPHATLARASVSTIQDWEGLTRTILSNEFGFEGTFRVENLMPDPENPVTRTISGLAIGRYVFSVRGGGTGNVVLSGDASDTVNVGEGFVFTLAATGSVTFTVNGSVGNYQLELNTDASNDAPGPFVAPNDSASSAGDIAVRHFDYENGASWV